MPRIFGYDPGGNGAHGIAMLETDGRVATGCATSTLQDAQAALDWFAQREPAVGIGIDTLTVLSTGMSSWRPADTWLREQYPQVVNSIAAPNSLYGAMGLNGLAVMSALRARNEALVVSETHPKVLWLHLTQQPYQAANLAQLNAQLAQWLGVPVQTQSEHEWDALVSCYAVMQGMAGAWPQDLHQLPCPQGSTLIRPCGPSVYYWP